MDNFSLDIAALILAIIFALVFLVLCRFPYFRGRALIKAGMAICLAIYCARASNPIVALVPMSIGFGFSALGDFFLDLPKDHFIAGLAAFLAAHLCFILYLAPSIIPLAQFGPQQWGITAGLLGVSLGFYLFLSPSLSKDIRLGVGLYSMVIGLFGVAALTTSLPSLYIPLGAVLFIASDMVLAIDRFKTPFKYGKPLNWALYASGQILLAIGAVSSLA